MNIFYIQSFIMTLSVPIIKRGAGPFQEKVRLIFILIQHNLDTQSSKTFSTRKSTCVIVGSY